MAEFDVNEDGFISTKELVITKFNNTLDVADQMLIRMVGSGGDGGYLGAMKSEIESLSDKGDGISATSLNIPDILTETESRPAVDRSGLDTNFGTFDKAAPTLMAMPQVDISGLTQRDIPASVSAAIAWAEQPHDTTLYDILLASIIADLQSGAGGLGGIVEQEIYDRALARKAVDEARAQVEIETYHSARGWDLPTGAFLGKIAEHVEAVADRNADINGKIMIEQADLAQKSQQFVIGVAKDLETLLRDSKDKINDRSLEHKKESAKNIIALFAEEVKAFIAGYQADVLTVEAQVESLKGAVEYNKGLISLYASEAEVFNTTVNAKSKVNEAIIGTIDAEQRGYDSETKAISADKLTRMKAWELKLENERLQLESKVAKADASIKGYSAEYGLKGTTAESMAKIVMQYGASALGATSAAVGLHSSTGRNSSRGYNHGYDETKEIVPGIRETISTNNSVDVTKATSEGERTTHRHIYQEG